MTLARRFDLSVLVACAFAIAVPAGAAECPQTSASDGARALVARNAPPWNALRVWVSDPPPSVEAAQTEVDHLGGLRILYEIDAKEVRGDLLNTLRAETVRVSRDAHIVWANAPVRKGDAIEVRLRGNADVDRLMSLIAFSARGVEATSLGEGLVRLAPGEAVFAERLRIAQRVAIEDLRYRFGYRGAVKASVEPAGPGRILVLSPGVAAINALSRIIDKGPISFHFFDQTASGCEARTSWTSLVVHRATKTPPYVGDEYVVKRQALVGSEDVADAVVALDPHDQPTVVFRLDAAGTYRLRQAVRDNVGQSLAIVSFNVLLAAPTIAEPLTGPVQIAGGFSLEEAEELAAMIRGGTPSPRLIVVEQQIIYPSPVNVPR